MFVWFVIMLALALFSFYCAAQATTDDKRVGGILFGCIFTFIMCFPIGYHFGPMIAKNKCENWGEQTEREVRFVHPSMAEWGCYVQWNNTWIPRGDYIRLTFGVETGSEIEVEIEEG